MTQYLIIPTVDKGDVLIPANDILLVQQGGGLTFWIDYQNHKNVPPSRLNINVLFLPVGGITPAPQATEIIKKSLRELLGSSSHTLTVPIIATSYVLSYI